MVNNFNEDQTDALLEFINIGLGAATSNIAELLDAFATLHVPKIVICDSDELTQIIKNEIDYSAKYYIIKQLFTGKFGGECMFIMKDSSANILGNHLYGIDNPSHDDINDAAMELTNILTSTIIGKMTHELGTDVQFFVPSSQFIGAKDIIDYEDIKHYSKIITISTILDFQDQQIKGCVYILTKDECIVSLKKLIDDKLEKLYS